MVVQTIGVPLSVTPEPSPEQNAPGCTVPEELREGSVVAGTNGRAVTGGAVVGGAVAGSAVVGGGEVVGGAVGGGGAVVVVVGGRVVAVVGGIVVVVVAGGRVVVMVLGRVVVVVGLASRMVAAAAGEVGLPMPSRLTEAGTVVVGDGDTFVSPSSPFALAVARRSTASTATVTLALRGQPLTVVTTRRARPGGGGGRSGAFGGGGGGRSGPSVFDIKLASPCPPPGRRRTVPAQQMPGRAHLRRSLTA